MLRVGYFSCLYDQGTAWLLIHTEIFIFLNQIYSIFFTFQKSENIKYIFPRVYTWNEDCIFKILTAASLKTTLVCSILPSLFTSFHINCRPVFWKSENDQNSFSGAFWALAVVRSHLLLLMSLNNFKKRYDRRSFSPLLGHVHVH